MKTKLTVTIDVKLLPKAKRFARSRGVSLSRWIEDALRRVSADQGPSFGERWRGKFQASKRGGERYRQLAKKYL
jgi:hypothetical protein